MAVARRVSRAILIVVPGNPPYPPYGYFAQRFGNRETKTITQVRFWLDEVPVDSAPLGIAIYNDLKRNLHKKC